MSKQTLAALEKPPIDRHVMRLYKAVANYVNKAGGYVVVFGGIQIQEWPGERKYNFSVAVKCTGRKPVFAHAKSLKGRR